MRKSLYILLILSSFVSFPLHSADRNIEHLSTLKRLIADNVAYDSLAPMDSVILWGEQVSPMLEEDNQIETYFRVRQLMVSLYSLRGDIGQAIDNAKLMYLKAKALNYDLGLALSSRAIGDAYYCSNMLEEAIDSYKEAIYLPAITPKNGFAWETTMLKLIFSFLDKGDISEVEFYRNMLLKSPAIHANSALQFFTAFIDVSYFIQKKELENARNSLKRADEIYKSDKQPFFHDYYCFMHGQYDEAIGNYQSALQYYNAILNGVRQKMTSIYYLQVNYAKANLLIKMGDRKGAAHLYEEISIITDSIVAPSYAHRINSLRTSYRENRIKVENEMEYNRILVSGLSIGGVILVFIVFLASYIQKQNKRIAESKVRLEKSRLKVENAIKSKSFFLSNMSHEIRTPLNAISGFSNILTDQGLDVEMRRQCGEVIQQNSELLLKLINDVIDLSNLETGSLEFKFGYADAITVCQNVIDTVNKVKQTSAEVRFETPLESLKLYTDDARLQQLLINLLINATKFTQEGSIVLEIRLHSEDMVLFSVTDTGCGIPLEKQDKIFNRFEKLNEGAQGTGLGLSICQLIIEHIGGRIWIDSDYTDGCRFCFTHPIHPSEKGKEQQL